MIRFYFHPTQRVAFFVGETGLPAGSFPSTPAEASERSQAKDEHATEFNAAIVVTCSAAGLASSVGLALSGLRSQMATPPIVTPARQHAGTVLAAVWADHGWTPLPKLDDFIVCVQIGYRTGAVV